MNLTELQHEVAALTGIHGERVTMADRLKGEIARQTERVRILTLTEAALTTLLADVSRESLQAIEQTITYGLRTVFDDRDLGFKFVVSQTRGAQTAEPVLTTGKREAPILDAYGGGPAQLVAFLLRLITCHRLGLYPLILMDEVFAMVSVEYAPNLTKLLRELAEKLGYVFVLVTQSHRVELTGEATKAYQIVDGTDGVTFKEL